MSPATPCTIHGRFFMSCLTSEYLRGYSPYRQTWRQLFAERTMDSSTPLSTPSSGWSPWKLWRRFPCHLVRESTAFFVHPLFYFPSVAVIQEPDQKQRRRGSSLLGLPFQVTSHRLGDVETETQVASQVKSSIVSKGNQCILASLSACLSSF